MAKCIAKRRRKLSVAAENHAFFSLHVKTSHEMCRQNCFGMQRVMKGFFPFLENAALASLSRPPLPGKLLISHSIILTRLRITLAATFFLHAT